MSTRIEAAANRTTTGITITISAADGESVPAALEVTDIVKFRITNYRNELLFELINDVPTDNDSLLEVSEVGNGTDTKPAVAITLAEADMTLAPGLYRWELLLLDDSETAPADARKRIDIGTLEVLRSAPEPDPVP